MIERALDSKANNLCNIHKNSKDPTVSGSSRHQTPKPLQIALMGLTKMDMGPKGKGAVAFIEEEQGQTHHLKCGPFSSKNAAPTEMELG